MPDKGMGAGKLPRTATGVAGPTPVTPLPLPVRPGPASYGQLDRRADEPELLPKPPLDEPQVRRIERPGGEEHEPRRSDAGLRDEQHPRRPPPPDRVRRLL